MNNFVCFLVTFVSRFIMESSGNGIPLCDDGDGSTWDVSGMVGILTIRFETLLTAKEGAADA